ncbi:MAG: GAF domain-containing SpoIIE family protein phosphatase [Longimicrobiales bacterium]
MTPEVQPLRILPDPVQQTLHDFERKFSLFFRIVQKQGDAEERTVYVSPGFSGDGSEAPGQGDGAHRLLNPRDGTVLDLFVYAQDSPGEAALPDLVTTILERAFEFSQEIRFFTYELSERYEEINLLYSISETLGSLLPLPEAAQSIMGEVCDVLGARRGSLWVYQLQGNQLELIAAVGEEGIEGPLSVHDPLAVTARVFREGRPLVVGRPGSPEESRLPMQEGLDYLLSVPIRYSPPSGEARTVGVINLIGRKKGGRFTASDQKLLSAIASQVGSALENHRLIRESLAQERVTREMELAHNLQMKLLPVARQFEGADVAARVQPAEQVGGDFFHLLHLSEGRLGVMIGDVSTHGFPAALIMALSISAATIYAMEVDRPAAVLRHLDDALRDELETTEMYLSLFYCVLDPKRGDLIYANAGHPHAFLIHDDGSHQRLLATDPPVGIAGPEAYGEVKVPWDCGKDVLLLFTDGISDTLGEVEGGGGEEIVLKAAIQGRRGDPQKVVDDLFRRAERSDPVIPADDRTVLVLRA